MTSDMGKTRPVRTYVAYGRGGIISAAVWMREKQFGSGKTGRYASVSVSRRYKDMRTNEWRNSSSFSSGELRKLRAVLDRVIADIETEALPRTQVAPAQCQQFDVEDYPADARISGQASRDMHQRGDPCVVY